MPDCPIAVTDEDLLGGVISPDLTSILLVETGLHNEEGSGGIMAGSLTGPDTMTLAFSGGRVLEGGPDSVSYVANLKRDA